MIILLAKPYKMWQNFYPANVEQYCQINWRS